MQEIGAYVNYSFYNRLYIDNRYKADEWFDCEIRKVSLTSERRKPKAQKIDLKF